MVRPNGKIIRASAIADRPPSPRFRLPWSLADCGLVWMLSVTFVALLPACIICGEKIAVAFVGTPDAENVMAGSVFPLVGLTAKLNTAVSPGRIVWDWLLLPAGPKLNGGAPAIAAASTVTETAADVLESEGELLVDCELAFVVGVYWAVRL